jgi:hypothetical protein
VIGIIINVAKLVALIVSTILSCLELWFFFTGNESDAVTIRDGLAACIFILMMILMIVS